MAENTGGTVDQGKIAADAQNIAQGNTPATTDTGANATPEASQTPQPDSINTAGTVDGPKGVNEPAKTGTDTIGPKPVGRTRTKADTAAPITQGAPGAAKPGAVANNENPGATTLTGEQAEDVQKQQLTHLYGPDFVTVRKGDDKGGFVQSYFSRRAWDLLGANKEGWKPVVETPQEVKDLQAQQNATPVQ